MKGKMLICSTLVCFLLVLVPATSAIQIHTIEKNNVSVPSLQDLKTMDAEVLQTYLHTLLKVTAAASTNDQKWQASQQTGRISSVGLSTQSPQGSPAAQNNQTLLEKIYWKVFNYRLLRFYVSVLIYEFHPTKLTTMRMLNWGIKVLRITQLGVLLGFIQSNPQPPTQPEITFQQNLTDKTLTATTVSSTTVLWSDIDQIGSGHCDPLPTGTVMAGDQITNCTGIIVLRYIPLNIVLGVFQFT
jgi:hypothetical protein